MERRREEWEKKEKKAGEEAALEHLEQELARQEAVLRKREKESGTSVGPSDATPAALVGMYMSSFSSEGSAAKAIQHLGLADIQRLHHHIRLRRRQEEKERNAALLSGPSGSAAVDGVIPLSLVRSQRAEGSGAGESGWRKLNQVSGEMEQHRQVLGVPMEKPAVKKVAMSLEPDLTVYSLEGDVRISSESVILQRQEQERRLREQSSPSSLRTQPASAVSGVAGGGFRAMPDDEEDYMSTQRSSLTPSLDDGDEL